MAGDFDETKATALKSSSYFKQSTAVEVEDAVADIQSAIKNGTGVKLTQKIAEPIVLEEALIINKDDVITVDLGENTMSAGIDAASDIDNQPKSYYSFDVKKGGELTISSGTISSRGIMVRDGAIVNIGAGVEVIATDSNGGSAIRNKEGGTVVVDGATLKTIGGDYVAGNKESVINNDPCVVYNDKGAKLVIKNATIINEKSGAYAVINHGDLTISNTTITSYRGGIHNLNGKALIENCTITSNWTSSAHALYVEDGNVTVKGGTFNVPAASSNCYAVMADVAITITGNPTWNGATKGI